jgi:AcrR family transcriptional regulator
MASLKISEDDLMQRLMEVFRTYGYEGASLARLSEATGLEKASLYHRFPKGKQEMAEAAARGIGEWFEDQVFRPLRAAGNAEEKVRTIGRRLREFYSDGAVACALDTLSLPGEGVVLNKRLRGALHAWLLAFTEVARESGSTPAQARTRAEQALLEIEGSLVLSRVLGDSKPFQRVIKRLPELLTAKP